jgi:hypothetical protein
MASGGKEKLNYLKIKIKMFINKCYYSLLNKKDIDNKIKKNNNPHPNPNNFGSYLAGLFEGDGHIWIPKDNMIKKHNPRFCITFHISDLPLAKIILKKIGYGFIRIKSKENAVVLTVSPIKGLKYIIYVISSYLRTPKINQVNNLLTWLNKHHNTQYSYIYYNQYSLDSDNWLTGFIDADGGFFINHIKKNETDTQKENFKLTLTIEQRLIDPITNESYVLIMKKIADFFKVNLRTRIQKSSGRSYFRVVAGSIISRSIVINYLTTYPLQTSKYLNYMDWKKASLIKTSKYYRHLSNEDKKKILYLKSNMNKNRSFYNWDHLKESNMFMI